MAARFPARRRTIAGLAAVTVLLTGATAAQAIIGSDEGANQAYRFAARIQIGELPGRSCSGALVAPQWVITAKACFGTGAAGVPAEKTTVTLGRTDLTSTAGRELRAGYVRPHPDRDVALVRLIMPVTDVPPIPVATTAPAAGEQLRLVGFGRTADTWVPDRLHGATVSVGDVGTGTFGVTGSDPEKAPVCRGDAGGPAVRTVNGAVTLAGLHHSSGQAGCLGTDGGSADATETRLDDIAAWIAQSTPSACSAVGAAHGTGQAGRLLPLADWNTDCRADIMNQNTAGQLHVFRNTGDLTADARLFTARAENSSSTVWTPANFPRVFTGDFTGDGRADLLNHNPAGQLTVYPGTGNLGPNALFPARRAAGTGFTTTAYPGMTTGDFNGDGRTDLAARLSSRIQLRIFLSSGDVSADNRLFSSAPSATLDLLADDAATESTIGDLLPGDFNGDGRTDIVGRNSDGKLYLWQSTGVATGGRIFTDRLNVGTGWHTTSYPRLFVGDFNADGRVDIGNQNTTGVIRTFVSTGDVSAPGRLFTASITATLGFTVSAYPRLLTGDLDGDGRTDLVGQATNGQLHAYRATGEWANEKLYVKPFRLVGSGWTTTSYPRIF